MGRLVRPEFNRHQVRIGSIASLIGHSGSSAFRPTTTTQCRCRSRARASLRNRHQALPSWESKTRRNNLPSGLAVTNGRSKRLGELTSSIVPRGTSFHRRVELEFPPIGCNPAGFHAATACSLVHRNSVPSTQMRCRITAKRRARATIAFFMPRRLAICIAQALSHDHLLVRVSMTWAAS